MNVHPLVRNLDSFRCVGKNEKARVGLHQIKRFSAILNLSAYRKLLTLEIRRICYY